MYTNSQSEFYTSPENILPDVFRQGLKRNDLVMFSIQLLLFLEST